MILKYNPEATNLVKGNNIHFNYFESERRGRLGFIYIYGNSELIKKCNIYRALAIFIFQILRLRDSIISS